ncbi:cysteine-rich venom protein-like [Dendropsophus ebraccatus]|uniref:cysteine-rich venom protein-like n=1 Tax=Dendropsophus ebraccatus TaxID=150705 RepID=UPI003831C714
MWIAVLCCALLGVYVVQVQVADPMAAVSTDNPDVQKKIVNITNTYRSTVEPSASNMVEVSWDPAVAKNADWWAKQCKFEHSKPEARTTQEFQCGENLFMSSYLAGWDVAFKSFDDEKKDFTYGKGANYQGAVVGHYTQQVWNNCRAMGCAVAYCPNGPKYKYFYVCQYCPPGNYVNSMSTPYKSGPRCGDCPNNCRNNLCTNPCKLNDTYSNCDVLAKDWCGDASMNKACGASCNCKTEIK